MIRQNHSKLTLLKYFHYLDNRNDDLILKQNTFYRLLLFKIHTQEFEKYHFSQSFF